MHSSNILSQKIVFQSKYFRVNQVAVEHNGKTFNKDIIERKNIVLVLPLTQGDEVYLVSQYRDALQKESLEVVAGQMDDGEDPLEAAKRELQEETGLTAESWKQVATLHVSANMVGKAHVFVATDLHEGKAQFDEDEDIETVKISFKEAIGKVLEGKIDIGSNIAALLLVDKLKEEGKI